MKRLPVKCFLQEGVETEVSDFGATVLSSTARWRKAAITAPTWHSMGNLALAIAPRSLPSILATPPRDSVKWRVRVSTHFNYTLIWKSWGKKINLPTQLLRGWNKAMHVLALILMSDSPRIPPGGFWLSRHSNQANACFWCSSKGTWQR